MPQLPESTPSAKASLYDAAASRQLDGQVIAQLGVSAYSLMQRAARAAFTELLQQFPDVRSVLVCCGKGNNAGDGYLLAALASEFGLRTYALAVVPPTQLDEAAARAFGAARDAGVTLLVDLPAVLPAADIVVDGLLGTGLRGAPRPAFAAVIEQINASGAPVLSLDIPSGVDASEGAAVSVAVRATATVTFITRKIGLYTGAGRQLAGSLTFADLDVPESLYSQPGVRLLQWRADGLARLAPDTYKHRQGHVVVAGGDIEMPGAIVLAATAALRSGAGLVTVLTRAQHRAALIARLPEAMVVGFDDAVADAPGVQRQLARADLVVLGPGLRRDAWGAALYALVQASGRPTLLDADGLYWLAAQGPWQGGDLSITPHVAEAGRLLAMQPAEIEGQRLRSSRELARRYNCRGVLKGPGSVVFGPTADIIGICAGGNPGMATAGMGDVLSGIAGALLAAPLRAGAPGSVLDANFALAVALHNAAGDAAALQWGQRSMLASDVIAQLAPVLRGTV